MDDRDAVDRRGVREVSARTGARQDAADSPALEANARALQLPVNPHRVVPGQNGRTNLDVWLEGFSRQVEAAPPSDAVGPPPAPGGLHFRR